MRTLDTESAKDLNTLAHGRRWARVERFGRGSNNVSENEMKKNDDFRVLSPNGENLGNLLTSYVYSDNTGVAYHKPVFDLDIQHSYIPSSSPGHGHLLLDVPLTEDDYETLLGVLVAMGILGKGSLYQFRARRMSTIRKPGLMKSGEQKKILKVGWEGSNEQF